MAYKLAHPLVKLSSKHQQRMRKLSCKIFNEFYVPELSSKRELDYGLHHPPIQQFLKKVHNDLRVYQRAQERPLDIDNSRNWNYYPPHPQVTQLIGALREYGLFRDEHQDFLDEMFEQAKKKGKIKERDPSQRKKKDK